MINSDIFQNFPEKGKFLVLDGAMGTQLEKKGANLKNLLWSASLIHTHPELILSVHLDYLEAGADILTSVGYQASFQAFIKNGFNENEAIRLMHRTIELGLEAKRIYLEAHPYANPPILAASMGPYGAFLANGAEYHGQYGLEKKELVQFHQRNIEILEDSPMDLWAFETIPSLLEAESIIEALNGSKKPAWISFTAKDEHHIAHGEKILDCIPILEKSNQIIGIGINCTAPEFLESLLLDISSSTQKFILAYPNRGEEYDAISKTWTPAKGLDSFQKNVEKWYKAGASIIGGCCGIGPELIRELKERSSPELN